MTENESLSVLAVVLKEQIRAVVFDAVGTIIYAMPSVTAVYCETIETLCGQAVDAGIVRSVLTNRLAARSETDDLSTSETAEREFWFDLIDELVPIKAKRQECFDALYKHFARPQNWRCYDDVAESLNGLHQRGQQLVVASNFDERLHRVCDGLVELNSIKQRVISSEVGWRKPAKQFFESVCERAGYEAEEILFVGDDPHNDIHGARSFGMPAVWIDRRGAPVGAIEETMPPQWTDGVWKIRSLRDLIHIQ